ncbi:MAG: hypothetical protein ABIZ56_06625 [Chthoniobacteraceae bacterium]
MPVFDAARVLAALASERARVAPSSSAARLDEAMAAFLATPSHGSAWKELMPGLIRATDARAAARLEEAVAAADEGDVTESILALFPPGDRHFGSLLDKALWHACRREAEVYFAEIAPHLGRATDPRAVERLDEALARASAVKGVSREWILFQLLPGFSRARDANAGARIDHTLAALRGRKDVNEAPKVAVNLACVLVEAGNSACLDRLIDQVLSRRDRDEYGCASTLSNLAPHVARASDSNATKRFAVVFDTAFEIGDTEIRVESLHSLIRALGRTKGPPAAERFDRILSFALSLEDGNLRGKTLNALVGIIFKIEHPDVPQRLDAIFEGACPFWTSRTCIDSPEKAAVDKLDSGAIETVPDHERDWEHWYAEILNSLSGEFGEGKNAILSGYFPRAFAAACTLQTEMNLTSALKGLAPVLAKDRSEGCAERFARVHAVVNALEHGSSKLSLVRELAVEFSKSNHPHTAALLDPVLEEALETAISLARSESRCDALRLLARDLVQATEDYAEECLKRCLAAMRAVEDKGARGNAVAEVAELCFAEKKVNLGTSLLADTPDLAPSKLAELLWRYPSERLIVTVIAASARRLKSAFAACIALAEIYPSEAGRIGDVILRALRLEDCEPADTSWLNQARAWRKDRKGKDSWIDLDAGMNAWLSQMGQAKPSWSEQKRTHGLRFD